MLEGFISPFDSTVWKNLKENGAVLIGKTNMDEFAMGSTTTHSFTGPCINPWSTKSSLLSCGGSSGGSACAVASGAACAAIGSDTGGSVRQPAALCGLVGFKPSYGSLSRHGLVSFSSSLDVPGVISRTVDDTRLVWSAMGAGKLDPLDSTNLVSPAPTKSLSKTKMPIKIGIPREYYIQEMAPNVEDAWESAIALLSHYNDSGVSFECVEVSLPNTRHALPAYYVIAPCEAYSNLARYDGIRYGFNVSGTKPFDQDLTHPQLVQENREFAFGEEVQRRVAIGSFALSRTLRDSYYLKALSVRRLVLADFVNVFRSNVDLLLTPTVPTSTVPLFPSEEGSSPVNEYLNDIFTVPASLAGLPAISVPFGKGAPPVGLQLIGPPCADHFVVEIAQVLETIGGNDLPVPPFLSDLVNISEST